MYSKSDASASGVHGVLFIRLKTRFMENFMYCEFC